MRRCSPAAAESGRRRDSPSSCAAWPSRRRSSRRCSGSRSWAAGSPKTRRSRRRTVSPSSPTQSGSRGSAATQRSSAATSGSTARPIAWSASCQPISTCRRATSALLVPFSFTPQQMSDQGRGNEFSSMIARLKPGATIEQLNAQMKTIVDRNLDRLPQFAGVRADERIRRLRGSDPRSARRRRARAALRPAGRAFWSCC